ncbi:ABC transporter ATP-binding protein [Lampropedia puyangensis]|uniref:ABC transporter ATP-binding protein n=1 Tax=Lampropedia puyangensis TaxID=1330072 RepID=A0A4S8EZC2_9BURK|nr:ABC transporter ATP-binding protein [Lampropedia puyangensis]THU00288.1 ABC transporter ATP-binding protein [Lampropedia puyangensis]
MTAILQVHGLVKQFGGLMATDHANLSVEQGELHALIGPNGAGKTTLIHQLSGALPPDAGRIVFAGQEITAMPMHQRARAGLARSYQITSIFQRLSVLDNLALALQSKNGSSMRFFRSARSDAPRYEQARALADQVGLSSKIQSQAGALSHGEQRQLEIGMVLALRPRLMLLDEPMAGMGAEESQRMVQLLLTLKSHTTMVLVEHDMDAVFQLADRISALVFGKVIATGTPDTIRKHPDVQQAYLGDSDGGNETQNVHQQGATA